MVYFIKAHMKIVKSAISHKVKKKKKKGQGDEITYILWEALSYVLIC